MKKYILMSLTLFVSLMMLGCGGDDVTVNETTTETDQAVNRNQSPDKPNSERTFTNKVTCRNSEGTTWTATIYKPGIYNPNNVCELDVLETTNSADWRALNDENYCDTILNEKVAEREAEGFSCS